MFPSLIVMILNKFSFVLLFRCPVLARNSHDYCQRDNWNGNSGKSIQAYGPLNVQKSDHLSLRGWFNSYGFTSLFISITYLFGIFTIQRWMKSRKPFNLRKPLALWSGLLAIFSIIGTINTFPTLMYLLTTQGIQQAVCNKSLTDDTQLDLWATLFIWSKLVELGDTLFVVLRKQKLLFLHYFHHSITFVYVFSTYTEPNSYHFIFGTLNYFVHSFMYIYYTLKALQFKVPRSVAQLITVLQIIQLIMGLLVSLIAVNGAINCNCDAYLFSAFVSLLMYTCFVLLFLNFFARSYVFVSNKKIL